MSARPRDPDSPPARFKRLNTQDVLQSIEGFYLAVILFKFCTEGVFEDLGSELTVDQIAARRNYDKDALSALFEFVSLRSDVLERMRAGTYKLRPPYTRPFFLDFQLKKFIGAYGPTVLQLERSLTLPLLGRELVDRAIEASAYRQIASPPNPVVLQLAKQLKIRSLLDLGSGPGTLLSELAEKDSRFHGCGIDSCPEMCAVARKLLARKSQGDRVRIICADARQISKRLSRDIRDDIEYLHAKGLFDELFRTGDEEAVRMLRTLRSLFPGRLLLIVDYYGKLTRLKRVPSRFRHTLVHDVIQILTAQGVPPSDNTGWNRVYESAGCALDHVYEGESNGIEWFVHLVRLQSPSSDGA